MHFGDHFGVQRLTLASPGAENGARQGKDRWCFIAPQHFSEKWCQSGAKRGSKKEPKCGKIMKKICMNFSTCLLPVFGGFPAVLAARIEPGGSKRGGRSDEEGKNHDLHNT